MTSVEGFNVKPARDLTEAEMRERLAKDCEREADDWDQRARHANSGISRNFFAKNARASRRRAASLRQGSPR